MTLPIDDLQHPSLIPVGSQFSFPVLQSLCSEAVGAWKFEILVEDSDSGAPSLVDVRTEYLFAYDFDIENFVWKTYEGEKGIIILLTFSCGGAFNVSG